MKVKSQEMYKHLEKKAIISHREPELEVFMKQHFLGIEGWLRFHQIEVICWGREVRKALKQKKNTIKGCKEKKHGLCSEPTESQMIELVGK